MSTPPRRGRPKTYRTIDAPPPIDYFKPRGIPLHDLEVASLTIEEIEAIRLADLEGLGLNDAAKKMNVSRRTFTRELKSARRKITDALITGKAIEIKGGHYLAKSEQLLQCLADGHTWKTRKNNTPTPVCPACGGKTIKKK